MAEEPRGRQQADLLVAHLGSHLPKSAAAIYTSPLQRAAQTAERVGSAVGLPVVRDADLREMGLGRWEGRTVPEIQATFPGAYERWLLDPAAHLPPEGEPLEDFARRVIGAFNRLQLAHPDADLVLVSHGGPIKALLCHILGLPTRCLFRFKQDNTAVSIVEADTVTRRLVLVNDTCHLADAGADLLPRDVLTDGGGGAQHDL